MTEREGKTEWGKKYKLGGTPEVERTEDVERRKLILQSHFEES